MLWLCLFATQGELAKCSSATTLLVNGRHRTRKHTTVVGQKPLSGHFEIRSTTRKLSIFTSTVRECLKSFWGIPSNNFVVMEKASQGGGRSPAQGFFFVSSLSVTNNVAQFNVNIQVTTVRILVPKARQSSKLEIWPQRHCEHWGGGMSVRGWRFPWRWHIMGGGISLGGGFDFSPNLVDGQWRVASMGVKHRSRCSRNHWSSNTTSHLFQWQRSPCTGGRVVPLPPDMREVVGSSPTQGP